MQIFPFVVKFANILETHNSFVARTKRPFIPGFSLSKIQCEAFSWTAPPRHARASGMLLGNGVEELIAFVTEGLKAALCYLTSISTILKKMAT